MQAMMKMGKIDVRDARTRGRGEVGATAQGAGVQGFPDLPEQLLGGERLLEEGDADSRIRSRLRCGPYSPTYTTP